MKIYLMRHADALPEINGERPLSELGKVNAAKAAQYLQDIAIQAKVIYHSGVLRAAQTAEIVAGAVGSAEMHLMAELNTPDAAERVIDAVQYLPYDVFLVGHIPLLPRLVSQLLVHNEDNWLIHFNQPATIVCLENIPNGWSLNWMIYPDILPPCRSR